MIRALTTLHCLRAQQTCLTDSTDSEFKLLCLKEDFKNKM